MLPPSFSLRDAGRGWNGDRWLALIRLLDIGRLLNVLVTNRQYIGGQLSWRWWERWASRVGANYLSIFRPVLSRPRFNLPI